MDTCKKSSLLQTAIQIVQAALCTMPRSTSKESLTRKSQRRVDRFYALCQSWYPNCEDCGRGEDNGGELYALIV
jgi:hypothetical protein